MRVLVTGATGGIGRELVSGLVERGETVWAHGRDRGKLGELGPGVERALVADLASLDEVRRLADEVVAAGGVEVLVNNAGVGFGADRHRREVSRDGHELRLAVNLLAPALLARRLVAAGAIRKAVVDVASAGQAPVDFDDLQFERGYEGVLAYRRSKLALIIEGFNQAAAHPGLPRLSLHPGTFLDTGMVRAAGITPQGSAADGRRAVLYVIDRALAGVSGRYFDQEHEARALPQAYQPEARERLERELRRLIG